MILMSYAGHSKKSLFREPKCIYINILIIICFYNLFLILVFGRLGQILRNGSDPSHKHIALIYGIWGIMLILRVTCAEFLSQ